MTEFSAHEHEELLADNLIASEKRPRFKALVKSKKGRAKLRQRLAHNIGFEKQCLTEVPPKLHTADQISSLLAREGAPQKCYVISEDARIDGQILDLAVALHAVVGSGMATLISCIPGELVYYEGEDMGYRLVIRKK